MTLEFAKTDNAWVAEIEVTAPTAIHIEKDQSGFVYVQEKTSGERFDSVKDLQIADSQMVIDVTYYALVYPKTIRVVSKYKPNKAEVV